MQQKELSKNYDPSQIEHRLYQFWMENKYFHAEIDPQKEPYTIVIPPPNVTGQLHMGHALDETLQDILIRYKRMAGFSTLWLPGCDHAGIATQIKVEEALRKEEGLTRYDLGRDAFLERVWAWKERYGSRITNQLKTLGCSCDWDRERFTMDEGCSKAVREVFYNLYHKGLIYKGHRIINWCPSCATALSDAEVEFEEQQGNFWHVRYPFKDDPSRYVEIATTRPETMLGDTAVAVHPEDERYTDLVGKMLILPLVGREIPVIADEMVEKDFGTGCVKITPAHDPNDFECGLRHDLEQIKMLNDDATVASGFGKYSGLDRYEARKLIVEDLEREGFLIKIVPHAHNVGTCYRCKTTVEPITSDQWFVKMQPLAEAAIRAVEEGDTQFVPDRFTKVYLNWMNNVHDWCISRQLWWGHRIPAFTCTRCGELTVSKEDITVCPKCGGSVKQDEDVLDTWFSSALWPFSTLGWPDETADMKYFYPTNTLVTGYDIIFFWVARMIFSAMEHTGQAPFKHVFIHGLVRDEQGRKMSKSLGNGIDPMDVIEKHGADALRFTLVTGNSPGNDMRFSWKKVEATSNFANKIWNAARFVRMNLPEEVHGLPQTLALEDQWILSRLQTVIAEVTENLDKFELGVASQKIYDFIWDDYCDWYIELSKARLFDAGADEATHHAVRQVLSHVLRDTMKLLHPFMPFLTEEVYQALGGEAETIMIGPWPKADDALRFVAEEQQMGRIMGAIRAIRNRRSEMNVPPSKKAQLIVVTDDADTFEKGKSFFQRLASASEVTITADASPENAVLLVVDGAKLYIPMAELVDLAAERERLSKELQRLNGETARLSQKLQNEGFVAKAPAAVVQAEQQKLEKYREMASQLEESLKQLG